MYRLSKLIPLLVGGLFVALVACEQKEAPPPDLIKEDTYIDLLVEMQMVKSLQETIVPDSSVADSLVPLIMHKYGVTRDQFRRSHEYYERQISEQRERISEAIDRLRMDQSTRNPSDEPEESEQ